MRKSTKAPTTHADRLTSATAVYMAAYVAQRDAVRLIRQGFAAATHSALGVLSTKVERLTFVEVSRLVVCQLARELVDLHGERPLEYPEGSTAERALAYAERAVGARYASGKCRLCNGDALPCARRHAVGRSCA